ncbi:MAG TPA: putative glycoside hydrolase, partial [Solirubrobacteraceae bacterium]|nr:putative glycoside hydrolase [Solirubrobacteraceae bacterium]
IRYGWASVLLGAGGHTAYCAAANYTGETWSSEYEMQIGEPASQATQLQGGVWKRSFTGGLVLVNPTANTVDVSFGGTYSGSGLTNATAAAMAPNTGLVLQGVASEKAPGATGGEAGSETTAQAGGWGASGSQPTGPGGAAGTSWHGSATTGLSEASSTGSGSTGAGSAGSQLASTGAARNASAPPSRARHTRTAGARARARAARVRGARHRRHGRAARTATRRR